MSFNNPGSKDNSQRFETDMKNNRQWNPIRIFDSLSVKAIYNIHWWLFFIPYCLFFFPACPDVVEDPFPPDPPVLVAKSLPEAPVEKGIDADNTGEDRIVLMWYPNREEDLAGYAVYRADTTIENGFKRIFTIDLLQNIGADTVFYDDSVSVYVQYYYYLTALDNADNESLPSDTVNYMLLISPVLYSPVDTTIAPTFSFKWMDREDVYYSNEYVIRVDDVTDLNNVESVWVCRFWNSWLGNETETPNTFVFFPINSSQPFNVIACQGREGYLVSNHLYRWKVKAIHEVDDSNLDEKSSESDWAFFSIE